MREAAMGFFDLHLRQEGDGGPVPEPAVDLADQAALRCLPDPPSGAATMRDVARQRLANPSGKSFDDLLRLNGGRPNAGPPNTRIVAQRNDGPHRRVMFTFESQPGLVIPAVLHLPSEPVKAAVVLVSEKGKAAAAAEFGGERLLAAGIACVAIDARGTGELDALNPRFMAYLGTGQPLMMGWDAARAVNALTATPEAGASAAELGLPAGIRIGVAGRGAAASQAAMFAALLSPRISFVGGFDGLRNFAECFEPNVPASAIQPRAGSGPALDRLRAEVSCAAVWGFRGELCDVEESLLTLVLGRH
jgi:hypothetical protein